MKSRRKRSKRMKVLHLWSWSEAMKAVPYLHSIVGSLREHWLDVLNAQRKLDLADRLKKPAKRQQILEREMLEDDLERGQEKFNDALHELNGIDVFLLEPVRGLALIPFRKEDDLAWYVFDHFAPPGVVGWRYHNDAIEECKPLSLLPGAIIGDPVKN